MPTYKHQKYHRMTLGRFKFDNHICHVSAEDDKEFRALVVAQPSLESAMIVEVNEAALQNLERPVVMRGASTASMVPSSMVSQANAMAVRRATQNEGGVNVNQSPINLNKSDETLDNAEASRSIADEKAAMTPPSPPTGSASIANIMATLGQGAGQTNSKPTT